MAALIFSDSRTDPLGAPINLHHERFQQAAMRAGLDPDTVVSLSLVDNAEGDGHGQVEVTAQGYLIGVCASDRIEFSEAASQRLNRNLMHLLRHAAQHRQLHGFFDTAVAEALMVGGMHLMEFDALQVERSIKGQPDLWPLIPTSLVAAQEGE